MTLDRKALAPGLRIMLWLCPLFMAKHALGLLVTPVPEMLKTPSFRTLNQAIPLKTLAVICLVVALGMFVSMALDQLIPYLFALGVMGVVMLSYTGVWIYSWAQGVAPLTAMDWPTFVAVSALATLTSLVKTLG